MRREADHAGETVLVAPQVVDHFLIGGQKRLGLFIGALSRFGKFKRTLVAQEKRRSDFGFDRLHCAARRARFTVETVAGGMNAARTHDFAEHPPNPQVLRSRHLLLLSQKIS